MIYLLFLKNYTEQFFLKKGRSDEDSDLKIYDDNNELIIKLYNSNRAVFLPYCVCAYYITVVAGPTNNSTTDFKLTLEPCRKKSL